TGASGGQPVPRAAQDQNANQGGNRRQGGGGGGNRPDDGPRHDVNYPVGITGVKMEEAPRTVGADEPPPLPPNEKLSTIGKPTPRLDGRLKVTGAAKYTADVRLPGMLYARMLTSPHPHARVLSIDTSAAAAHPNVRAVHILERVRDVAELRDKSK